MEMGSIYGYSHPVVKIIGPSCNTLLFFWKNITLHGRTDTRKMLKHVLKASIIFSAVLQIVCHHSACESSIFKLMLRFAFSTCKLHTFKQLFLIALPSVFTQTGHFESITWAKKELTLLSTEENPV